MTKKLKLTFKNGFLIFAMALFAVSCSPDDGSVFDTPLPPDETSEDDDEVTEPEVATIVFNEAVPTSNITSATASGEVGTSVPGRVIFTSDVITQRRLYITQNISGQGEMPFNSFDLTSDDLSKVLKADGSIDLVAPSKSIEPSAF